MADNECQLHIHFYQFLMETFPNTKITVCGNFSKNLNTDAHTFIGYEYLNTVSGETFFVLKTGCYLMDKDNKRTDFENYDSLIETLKSRNIQKLY